jgi:hypothetical protein
LALRTTQENWSVDSCAIQNEPVKRTAIAIELSFESSARELESRSPAAAQQKSSCDDSTVRKN